MQTAGICCAALAAELGAFSAGVLPGDHDQSAGYGDEEWEGPTRRFSGRTISDEARF